jgi:hypothetical protein
MSHCLNDEKGFLTIASAALPTLVTAFSTAFATPPIPLSPLWLIDIEPDLVNQELA